MFGLFRKKKAPEKVGGTTAAMRNHLTVTRKVKPVFQRNFASAETELFTGWTSTPQHPDQLVYATLTKLRARSREQANNNDYAKKFVNMIKCNVVGPSGFQLQALCRRPDGTVDKLDADAIEKAWSQWNLKEFADYQQRMTFKEMQRLLVSSVAVDGEAITVMRTDLDNPYKVSLELIDPEYLPVDHNRVAASGNLIRFSIEYDGRGRPVAYHFQTQDKHNMDYSIGNRYFNRIPASSVLHLFLVERIGQKRGVPWMATPMMRMKLLDGLEEAAITAARAGAAKMGFFKTRTGEGYSGEMDGEGNYIDTVEAGQLETLPEHIEDFIAFDPKYPDAVFKDAVKTALRGIASGLGVAYEGLSNDREGVNYSSIRQGALDERDVYMALQEWVIDCWLVPVYNFWIYMAVNARAVSGPTGAPLPPRQLEKFHDIRFQGKRWKWVDPSKDVGAELDAIAGGLKSRGMVIRENGHDPEQVWTELEAENERLSEILRGQSDAGDNTQSSSGSDEGNEVPEGDDSRSSNTKRNRRRKKNS